MKALRSCVVLVLAASSGASYPVAAEARTLRSLVRGAEHAVVYMAARKATETAISAGERAYGSGGRASTGGSGNATETVRNPLAR